MGKFLFAVCLLLIPLAQAEANDAEDRYQALLKVAEADPAKADWQALRFAYSETPEFNVMDGWKSEERKKVYAAFGQNDFAAMLDHTNQIIARDFVDLLAHRDAAVAYDSLNKKGEFEKESLIFAGLINSVETGDGLSTKSPLTVISVEEEYLYLITKFRHVTRQVLLRDGDHAYDVLSTVDVKSGKTQDYYFLIDRVLASESKLLSPQ
jgi:hypothetical protein